jgi:Fic family protein
MKDSLYHPKISGEVRTSADGYSYFYPYDLPFDFQADDRLREKIDNAMILLSRLDGAVSAMEPEERDILLRPFMLMESSMSSAIEGTSSTTADLYRAERIPETDPTKIADNREVLNYRDAMIYGMENSSQGMTHDLIKQMHRILMDSVRGEDKEPGEYRDVPVFIGRRGDSVDTVRFIPPMPDEIRDKMDALIEYINEGKGNVLMRAAFVHYQFETIHPFRDGNGRMGRLLIMMMLASSGLLRHPVLYLSGFFRLNKGIYTEALNVISREDDIYSWMDLFMRALISQSKKALDMLASLHEYRRTLLNGVSGNERIVLESLFRNPYLRVSDVASMCDIHVSTAGRLVDGLVDRGILREVTGNKRNRLFVSDRIMDIIDQYR